MVLRLFKAAEERAKGDVYALEFEVMKQASVKAYFSGGAEELHDEKMYELAKSRDYTQGLVRPLIKSSTFLVPVASFV